ncbi:LOW QUALITY PROTEIN: hypothetical protein PHMEG_00032789 [Phytophthora megakarya]|uniref:Eukaryotic/viral aspartic protease n=1 Tax=Phytophthora megakarya TaxID=4795 RepID=A0A225UX63_9STRA|nr:LOW QUALITY PROTEIN: hypothetical protein PHMEG_00032789 [Phytophthora megakarya]
MLDTSSWIQLFAPKAARQAVWDELVKELSYPANSTSTSQVVEDTVSLLMAMSMEAHAYPSSTALADWTAGTELQRWKWKLKTAFGSKDVGAGRQPVVRSAGERMNPANIPLPRTPKKITRAVFGSAEQSPYFHDSHMVTLRHTLPGKRSKRNRRRTLGLALEEALQDVKHPPTTRPVTKVTRSIKTMDEKYATTELAWQIREHTAMEEMDPTPRIDIAQHRPLGKITPFRGKLDESENSMQWLRGYVYEMKGTKRMVHGLPTESQGWYRTLAQSSISKDEAYLEFADSSVTTAHTSFNQQALGTIERSGRKKDHIRDYLNRLNGYARSANINFEHSGREAKEHVKHFWRHRDLERQLTPMWLRDIHTLEDIVSDIQKVEMRVSNRSSSQIRVGVIDATIVAFVVERSRSEPRHTSRVAQVDASVTDLIPELQTRASSERPNEYSNDYSVMKLNHQDECDNDCGSRDEIQGEDTYSDQDERLVAAANENQRRNAANGTFARSDKRPQNYGQQSSGFGQGGFRLTTQSGSRFNDNRGGHGFQRPSYGPCAACGGQNHSTHFCFRRCRLCQQVHDFDKCEAFDELAKILRTNVDKKNISPELQKLVFGGHLN